MFRKLYLLLGTVYLLSNTAFAQVLKNYNFRAPICEEKCINYFNDTASGVNNVNAFLLAKMTELMYLERLDYQMRYISNDCKPIDTIESTDAFRAYSIVKDTNFQVVYAERFKHYFNNSFETEGFHEEHKLEKCVEEHTYFKFIHKIHTHDARFLGIKYKSGLDPELMLISTPTTIFILLC